MLRKSSGLALQLSRSIQTNLETESATADFFVTGKGSPVRRWLLLPFYFF
jgi:hypothetical protein